MNDSTKDNDCLNPGNNSKCCFFKVANAFLLLFVFLLVIVLAIYAPRVIKGNSLGFDYVGVIVAILAALITVLITWQIYNTIRSTHQIEKIEEDFEDLNKNIDDKVAERMNVLEKEASAMICVSLAKSPIHLHQFSEALNERFDMKGVTNMLNHSLYYFAAGLENLSSLPNSENYDDIYEGLEATIKLIEECESVLTVLQVGVVDAVIKGIKNDKNPHDGRNGEGINKKNMISRLEKIKADVLAIKAAARKEADARGDETTHNTTEE